MSSETSVDFLPLEMGSDAIFSLRRTVVLISVESELKNATFGITTALAVCVDWFMDWWGLREYSLPGMAQLLRSAETRFPWKSSLVSFLERRLEMPVQSGVRALQSQVRVPECRWWRPGLSEGSETRNLLGSWVYQKILCTCWRSEGTFNLARSEKIKKNLLVVSYHNTKVFWTNMILVIISALLS